MTNKSYEDSDPVFRKSCELAKTPPTRRQASKFRRDHGVAAFFRHEATRLIEGEKK